MRTITGGSTFIVAIITALLFAQVPQVRADIFDDADAAIKECDRATKDAQDLNPVKSVRDAENELDQAEQKLDEVNSKTNPPASDDEKENAKTARDDAKEAADKAQANGNQQNKGKYENYRDALKRRRDACNKLKKLIPDMQSKIGPQAKTISDEIVNAHKSTLQKARNCVKKCGEPPTMAMVLPGMTPGGGTFAALVSNGQVAVNLIGTGETIGEVADLRIDNLTDQPINCSIPPVILESKSGKNQDYVVPHGENVALKPHESKMVPMDGVCVNRHKQPVGKGVGDDLAINDPSGNLPRDERSHLKRDDSDKLLRIAKSKYDAAKKLDEDGLLKEMPYKDKKKRKEIVEQWSTWTDPQISEIEGGPPATKDDLKKVVYKQVPHEMTTDEKKKIDKGIDTIWDKIELTNDKAKDYEKPEGDTVEETPPPTGPGTINVSNDTPTPAPQTTEKPKKEKPEKPNPSPAKNEKPPMTTTRLLVNVLKGVDAHDADDVTRPSKDSIKKDLAKAVKDANKLLSKCGVQLELGGADIVFDAPNPDTPGSENMGGNYDGDKAKDIDKKAGEELKKAHGQPTKGFKVYIVTEITNKSGSEQGVGYWFPEDGSDVTHPGFCILEASVIKDGRLLAHEVCHGLGGLSDEDKKGNLMNPNPGKSDANDLSDDQCKKLQNGAKQRE